jgi:hypothetical protein
MADFVRITKSGLKGFEWDGDIRDYREVEFHSLTQLRSKCEIEEGVTLADIFNVVEQDEALTVVIAKYAWCEPIKEFHAQAKLPRPETDKERLLYIELSKYAEFHQYKGDALPTFDISTHMTAYAENGDHYTISYTPLNEVAHLMVKIKPEMEFQKNYENIPDWKCTTYFTLLDLLDTIYYDISFQGGPEDNKRFLKHLDEMMTEIKEHPEQCVPFEDLQKLLDA